MTTTIKIITTLILVWFSLLNESNSTKFTTLLIFGDSTVDSGNNNFINTLFKSNYLPYGRDFPGSIPTGRFSNGKLVPDLVTSHLGINDRVPPFLDPNLSVDELMTGVSFASAGSGFDELTTVASGVIPVSKQISELFRKYIVRLEESVGKDIAAKIVGNAVVIISAGTNDWCFNFYDLPTRKLEFDSNGYRDFLLNKIHTYVKELYSLGCRKILVTGLPPIGCLPIQITAKLKILSERKCLEDQNSDAKSFNVKLANMLQLTQTVLPGSKLLYVDVYERFLDMVNHPLKYGFTEVRRGCCGTGLIEAALLCNPATPICRDPSRFLFWDCIHPTEAAYQFFAESIQKEILPKLMR